MARTGGRRRSAADAGQPPPLHPTRITNPRMLGEGCAPSSGSRAGGNEMIGHRIEWTHDGDRVTARMVCGEPEGADCRLTCEGGCEEWVIVRDAEGPYHLSGETKCRMRDAGECGVVLWMTDGYIEELRSGDLSPVVIGSLPVTTVWEGDGYSWEVIPR